MRIAAFALRHAAGGGGGRGFRLGGAGVAGGGGGGAKWRGALHLGKWVMNARIELDWGGLPVTISSVWNGDFADRAVTGPRTTLFLKGTHNSGVLPDVGMKLRGAFPVAPRLSCRLASPPPPPPPATPAPPNLNPRPPPPPAACLNAKVAILNVYGGGRSYQGEALQLIVTPQSPFPKKTSYSTIRA